MNNHWQWDLGSKLSDKSWSKNMSDLQVVKSPQNIVNFAFQKSTNCKLVTQWRNNQKTTMASTQGNSIFLLLPPAQKLIWKAGEQWGTCAQNTPGQEGPVVRWTRVRVGSRCRGNPNSSSPKNKVTWEFCHWRLDRAGFRRKPTYTRGARIWWEGGTEGNPH